MTNSRKIYETSSRGRRGASAAAAGETARKKRRGSAPPFLLGISREYEIVLVEDK